MNILVTAIVVAIPTYFYAAIVRSIDRFEKEPIEYLIGAFCWGAVPSIIVAIILQTILSVPVEVILGTETLAGAFVDTAITAPVTEEILKAMAVAAIYLTRRREFDGWVDGIVYGSMAGFGFAYVENILYLVNQTETIEEWVVLFLIRVIALGFMHGFWTALTGIGFGFARYRHNPVSKIVVISLGLLAAIAGHLIHNGSLVIVDATESGEPLLIALVNYLFLGAMGVVLWFVAGFNGRRLMKNYLADEVPHTLSPEDYQVISGQRRSNMTQQRNRALTQAAAELAQKKFQQEKMKGTEDHQAEIATLRDDLRRLSLG